jgi:hypothetical protein
MINTVTSENKALTSQFVGEHNLVHNNNIEKGMGAQDDV